jgi:hypothetical protein
MPGSPALKKSATPLIQNIRSAEPLALVLRQMRRLSSGTQLFLEQVGLTQRMRCFFQASNQPASEFGPNENSEVPSWTIAHDPNAIPVAVPDWRVLQGVREEIRKDLDQLCALQRLGK